MACIINQKIVKDIKKLAEDITKDQAIIGALISYVDGLLKKILLDLVDYENIITDVVSNTLYHIASAINAINSYSWMAYIASYNLDVLYKAAEREKSLLINLKHYIKKQKKNEGYEQLESISKYFCNHIQKKINTLEKNQSPQLLYSIIDDLDTVIKILKRDKLGFSEKAMRILGDAIADYVDNTGRKIKKNNINDSNNLLNSLAGMGEQALINIGEDMYRKLLINPLEDSINILYYGLGINKRDVLTKMKDLYETFIKDSNENAEKDLLNYGKNIWTSVRGDWSKNAPNITLGGKIEPWINQINGDINDLSVFGANQKLKQSIIVIKLLARTKFPRDYKKNINNIDLSNVIYTCEGTQSKREQIKDIDTLIQNIYLYQATKVDLKNIIPKIEENSDINTTIEFLNSLKNIANQLDNIKDENPDPVFSMQMLMWAISNILTAGNIVHVGSFIDGRLDYLNKILDTRQDFVPYHNYAIERLLEDLKEMGLYEIIETLLNNKITIGNMQASINEIIMSLTGGISIATQIFDLINGCLGGKMKKDVLSIYDGTAENIGRIQDKAFQSYIAIKEMVKAKIENGINMVITKLGTNINQIKNFIDKRQQLRKIQEDMEIVKEDIEALKGDIA